MATSSQDFLILDGAAKQTDDSVLEANRERDVAASRPLLFARSALLAARKLPLGEGQEDPDNTLSTLPAAANAVLRPKLVWTAIGHRITLQKWEGTVTKIEPTLFVARLRDLTEPGPEEEADFPIEEVSADDRALLDLGAVFYWTIGYVDSPTGQRTRASEIRFRRFPVWTKSEIDDATLRAKRIKDSLAW